MSLHKRLTDLEQANRQPQEQGQRIERYTVEDEEYVQIYWNGDPMGKVMYAWQWDTWDEAAEGQQ